MSPFKKRSGPSQVWLCGGWYSCKHAGSGQHLPFLFSTSTLEILPYAFLELQGSAFTTYNLIYSWRSCHAKNRACQEMRRRAKGLAGYPPELQWRGSQ
jgi:hypothetical protein